MKINLGKCACVQLIYIEELEKWFIAAT